MHSDKNAYENFVRTSDNLWCEYTKCSEMKGFWCSLTYNLSGREPCRVYEMWKCPIALKHKVKIINGEGS